VVTNAAQRYHDMTDDELIDFVSVRLPKMLWRVQNMPRCLLCRDTIIAELGRNPLFHAIDKEEV
jgi:hypothetical protein